MAEHEKESEAVHKVLVEKYDFLPKEVHELTGYCGGLVEFVHEMAEKHYFNEGIVRRVTVLATDADSLDLKAARLQRLADELHFDAEKTMLHAKRKSTLAPGVAEEFKKLISDVRKTSDDVASRAADLNREIRAEYEKKSIKPSEY